MFGESNEKERSKMNGSRFVKQVLLGVIAVTALLAVSFIFAQDGTQETMEHNLTDGLPCLE
jgi:flagellar basal body-associated protein FliL